MHEFEVGERIHRGVRIGFLWRSKKRGDLGVLAGAEDRERTIRGEVEVRHRAWRARARLEEKNTGSGRSRINSIRFGRSTRVAWEGRLALVVRDVGAPEVWWHSRRAGGLYGWDRLSTGTWVGAWVGVPLGRLNLEASADARSTRWDMILAIRVPMG
jgi:hypothetical protein